MALLDLESILEAERQNGKRFLGKASWVKAVVLVLAASLAAQAHDVITTKVTFDREILRLFNAHCISCHRDGGSAFSLATYSAARPWAKAIGEQALTRRMPPWGAVKGFGDFRKDQGLTAEQLELIVDWEEGGAPEGDEKDIPPEPKLLELSPPKHPANEIIVSGDLKLAKSINIDGIWPVAVPDSTESQITAELPDGGIECMLWLHNYKQQFSHPFLLKTRLELRAGTVVRGVPAGASVALLPINSNEHQTGQLLMSPGQP